MKKKTTRIIAIGAVLIFAVVSVVLGYNISKNYVEIDNDEKIVEMAKDYILNINEKAEVTEVSEVVRQEELGLVSVLIKYEQGKEKNAYCVYLSKTKYFDNMYEIQGALGTETGEIVADSQKINGKYVAFIRGIDIPDNISNYSVEKLDYAGAVENGWCLEIVETDCFGHYDVTIE